MLREAKLLTALELKNLFGLNTLRHTKDKAKKRNATLLSVVWVILIAMVMVYVGGLVYGLVLLGLKSLVGAYLAFLASVVILAFGIFKAGENMPVSEVEATVQAYLDLKLRSWMDEYMPEEKYKVEDAECKVFGDYVMYCILSAEDASTAFATFEGMLK